MYIITEYNIRDVRLTLFAVDLTQNYTFPRRHIPEYSEIK